MIQPRMFWLAASLSMACAQAQAGGVQQSPTPALVQNQTTPMDPALAAAWTRISPSVVVVQLNNMTRGTAALIDQQGYFITGNTVVSGKTTLDGVFYDGHRVTLFVVAVDGPTQLALLRTYDPIGDRKPVNLFIPDKDARIDFDHPKSLIAALAGGPFTAELVSTKTLALLRSQRAVSLLSEIHFESADVRVGGAPVFTSDGYLVGVLQAALASSFGSLPSRSYGPQGLSIAPHVYGPGGQTVAYSPGPAVMQRVIRGFLTPKHEVLRPAIGVLVRDAPHGGAYVDEVLENSPAKEAGLEEGDIITNIEGATILKQVDFARVMLQQVVGSDIAVSIRRDGHPMNFQIRVGM